MKKPHKSALKAVVPAKGKKKMPHDVPAKDMAFERNFTKDGKPRLAAQSGEGSMGQRR